MGMPGCVSTQTQNFQTSGCAIRGRRPSVRPLVGNDLFQALDAIFGEGRYAILTDALDVQAAVLREHVDREFVQPVLIFAEHFGDVVDGEDGCDGAQGQAA